MKPLNVPMQQSGTPIMTLNVRVSFWPLAEVMVTVTLNVPTRSGVPVTHPVAASYARPEGNPENAIVRAGPARDAGAKLRLRCSPAAATYRAAFSSANTTASFTTTILRVFVLDPFLYFVVYVPAVFGVPVHLPVEELHVMPEIAPDVFVHPLQSEIVTVAFTPV